MKIIKANLTNEKQAQDYIDLMSHYACDPMGGGQDLSDEVKAVLPQALVARQHIVVYMAYNAEDQPLGLITLIEGFSTFTAKPLLNIHDVIVMSENRGQGIAGRLLFAAEAEAKKRGCCKLTLEVLEGNEAAQKVYKDFGFAPYMLDEALGLAHFWEKTL